MRPGVDISTKRLRGISAVAMIRLLSASLTLLAICIDPSQLDYSVRKIYPAFALYMAYSIILYVFAWHPGLLAQPFQRWTHWVDMSWAHWLDMGWYTLLSVPHNGINSSFIFGLYFSISVAALRWGFMSGVRVALGSVILFIFILLGLGITPSSSIVDLNRLVLLRAINLLVLSSLVAYWGSFQYSLRRWLRLLRSITRLTNSRFSSGRTIDAILRIENEGTDAWVSFMPRSITERAEALGGHARVSVHDPNLRKLSNWDM